MKKHILPKDIVHHELIGLHVKIIDSKNPKFLGVEGVVADESRNMLTIDVGCEHKKFAKEQCIFSFKLPAGWVKVSGSLLIGRPEDRIKKKTKQW